MKGSRNRVVMSEQVGGAPSRLRGTPGRGSPLAPSLVLRVAERRAVSVGVASRPQLPGVQSWFLHFLDLDLVPSLNLMLPSKKMGRIAAFLL